MPICILLSSLVLAQSAKKDSTGLKQSAGKSKVDSSISSTRTLSGFSKRDRVYLSDKDTIHLYDSGFDGLQILEGKLSDYKVFITGENHMYTESNARLWLKMIKYLHANAGVRNIMFEYGYSYGYLVNEYLQTGDTTLFNSIDQFAYEEYSAMLKDLKVFNDNLPYGDKLYFAAIDIDRGVYPLAKVLGHLLPDKSADMPDSIEVHIQSIRSLTAYNDFKLVEEDDINSVYTSGNGFKYKTLNTLRLAHQNFLSHKSLYRQYLGDNFAKFESIMDTKYKAREQWVKFESDGAIQEYIYRETYMHQQFIEEQAAHDGNWFGQFGRCHTTKDFQNSNSCEWFQFSSLADRIESTKGGAFEEKVMTMAIVYLEDMNFGPETKDDSKLLNKYFEDMSANSISINDISGDSALSERFYTDFNYIIFNTHTARGNSYSNLNKEKNDEDDFIGKLMFGYSFNSVGLENLNARIAEDGGLSSFNTMKPAKELSFEIGSKKFYTAAIFGLYNDEQLILNNLEYSLSGFFVKDQFFFNMTHKKKRFDILPGIGIGYAKLNLNTNQTNSLATPDLADAFLGEKRNVNYINDALNIDFGVILDFNIKHFSFGLEDGYLVDLSNKKWKSGKEELNSSPSTSFTGWHHKFRVGISF